MTIFLNWNSVLAGENIVTVELICHQLHLQVLTHFIKNMISPADSKLKHKSSHFLQRTFIYF